MAPQGDQKVIDPLVIFSFGVVFGLIPPILYGKIGGDEEFEKHFPELKSFLHTIHHAYFGLMLIIFSTVAMVPYRYFILGWGLATMVDDLLFHSFSNYFERK